jgi:hypothetical protein
MYCCIAEKHTQHAGGSRQVPLHDVQARTPLVILLDVDLVLSRSLSTRLAKKAQSEKLLAKVWRCGGSHVSMAWLQK